MLSRLERVDLRAVWVNEATSFTPWLAQDDNLNLLADAIGLDLACEGTEQNVGPFRADILCKAAGNSDHWVLIENQIERTDHSHLGQLITYAAGLHTATIVWVAQRFTDEHRAALDWLNEITGQEISFFGLEIELWRIADSPPAPKFNVVCQPNEWVKEGERAKSNATSGACAVYREFWTEFVQFVKARSRVLRPESPTGDSWMNFPVGRANYCVGAMTSVQKKRVVCYFWVFNDTEKAIYRQLMDHRPQLDSEIPNLEWKERPGGKGSSIEVSAADMDPNNRYDWPRQHAWMLENLERFHQVFAPIVKQLP
jgi:hypothetical protein